MIERGGRGQHQHGPVRRSDIDAAAVLLLRRIGGVAGGAGCGGRAGGAGAAAGRGHHAGGQDAARRVQDEVAQARHDVVSLVTSSRRRRAVRMIYKNLSGY